MNFESLANELLLDIFEYFGSIDLLRAFHNLNYRLNSLLSHHFQTHGLDFQSVSKYDFDTICREHLPSIIDQITSLRLSDNDDTPQQIDYFFAQYFTLHHFLHIQSLSLCYLQSSETINKIMLECHHLSNLTHLKFDKCSMLDGQVTSISFVNSIWSLSKLNFCYLDINLGGRDRFLAPTIISSSLEHVYIHKECHVQQLACMFEHTPCLRQFSTSIGWSRTREYLTSPVQSIITFKVLFTYPSEQLITNIFQSMPNLHHLTIDIHKIYINGRKWEEIIRNHLLKLERFRLKMNITVECNINKDQKVNEILDSFRSRFWIEERRWYVRCDWVETDTCIVGSLYTLPYAFDTYILNASIFSKSTCSHDNNHWSYDRVHSFICQCYLSEERALSYLRFNNLRHFHIQFPISNLVWSMVPKFDRLISLVASHYDCNNETCQSQLQYLLDRAPRFASLTFMNCLFSPLSIQPFDTIKHFVRKLDLPFGSGCYDNQHCAVLSRSPLGIHCKWLHIRVDNRTCILDLVNTMNNLQALNVSCNDDDVRHIQSTPKEDECINWLRNYLPSTCLITRNSDWTSTIRLWIR